MENFKTFVRKVFEYRKFIYWKTRLVYKNYFFLPSLRLFSKIRYQVAKANTAYDFVIIDDFLPNIYSAFRANEFAYLLRKIDNSALFTIMPTKIHPYQPYFDYYIHTKKQFKTYKAEFAELYEIKEGQILPFYTWTKFSVRLAYVVFLHNAYYLVEYFEQHNIRFIVELYPGGGFKMTPESNERLQKVLGSPMMEAVLVTQKPTYKYLLDNDFCDKNKITFKYGGILPTVFFNVPKKGIRYPHNKDTIDICFTAAKYMEKGVDKGYDIFIEVAHLLLEKSDKYRFHVVGGFDENDIEIKPKFKSNIYFYGFLKTPEFIPFYKDKDIFISPNRPFMLGKGAFDGFPTGAAGEAGLNGVCMMVSDELDQNVIFADGIDSVFIKNDAIDICNKILDLEHSPEKIYEIGEAGKQLIISDNKTQLPYRLELIKKYL